MNRYSALDEIKRLQEERFAHSIGSREWKKIGEQLSELHEIAYPGTIADDDPTRDGLGPLGRR